MCNLFGCFTMVFWFICFIVRAQCRMEYRFFEFRIYVLIKTRAKEWGCAKHTLLLFKIWSTYLKIYFNKCSLRKVNIAFIARVRDTTKQIRSLPIREQVNFITVRTIVSSQLIIILITTLFEMSSDCLRKGRGGKLLTRKELICLEISNSFDDNNTVTNSIFKASFTGIMTVDELWFWPIASSKVANWPSDLHTKNCGERVWHALKSKKELVLH